MKDESGFSKLPTWVKEWLALSIILSAGLIVLAYHLGKADKDTWSAAGSLSGWASAAVSAFGFIFIYYQLRQHHEDSTRAEERHAEVLTEQQKMFEQNAQISLFKERLIAARAILEFAKVVTEDKANTDYLLQSHLNFLALELLFKNVPNVGSRTKEVMRLATDIMIHRNTLPLKFYIGAKKPEKPLEETMDAFFELTGALASECLKTIQIPQANTNNPR